MNRFLDNALCQFLRIADRRGGENELRLCSIKICHAFQPADDVGDMRTEHTAIGVSLVNNDEAQIREKLQPVGVMWQDAGMEHVGIAQHDACVLADSGPGRLGGIAIVNRNTGWSWYLESRDERLEVGKLILG